jgi:hypothetical protein
MVAKDRAPALEYNPTDFPDRLPILQRLAFSFPFPISRFLETQAMLPPLSSRQLFWQTTSGMLLAGRDDVNCSAKMASAVSA